MQRDVWNNRQSYANDRLLSNVTVYFFTFSIYLCYRLARADVGNCTEGSSATDPSSNTRRATNTGRTPELFWLLLRRPANDRPSLNNQRGTGWLSTINKDDAAPWKRWGSRLFASDCSVAYHPVGPTPFQQCDALFKNEAVESRWKMPMALWHAQCLYIHGMRH